MCLIAKKNISSLKSVTVAYTNCRGAKRDLTSKLKNKILNHSLQSLPYFLLHILSKLLPSIRYDYEKSSTG